MNTYNFLTVVDVTVGEKIKALRMASKLTQEAFAEPLGIKKSHISAIESGKKSASETILILVRLHYRVNPIWWETGEGEIFMKRSRAYDSDQARQQSEARRMMLEELQYASDDAIQAALIALHRHQLGRQ